MTLREIIRNLCKEENISMNRLEEELGFARGYLSKLDKSVPNTSKIMQIADYFDVSTDYLLGRTDIKSPNNVGVLEEIPLALLNRYQAQGMTDSEMIEAYTAFRKAENEDALYDPVNTDLPKNIRAAARDLMDLPKDKQKLAFDIIKAMIEKGKEAKDNEDT